MPAKLKNGVIGASGGRRENAGRLPNAIKLKCQKLGNSTKFLAWAKKVLEGDYTETKVTKDGEVVKVPVSVGDRVYLWEKVCDRGFGKAPQSVTLGGDPESPVKFEIVPANANAGNKGH